ncbi:xanthine dehydrogenase family protein molybdopterin-binding subunit [Salinicola endophyticus]|uniref:Xanthine dehydrogenase family protein molybdopterin-binding subunit n=1 Tax=Salinicola endophyticus TaxID=1949083 RepID=A0ABY8FD48_9GAMM|nr:xanthine dehydrogenase family protein molybdopterin-binding subunit [Salinicola endophyticus]WFF40739.1 xanthine dehydrogenase family protein molybdopterin-binding subunit [Salinicola endophyticus]
MSDDKPTAPHFGAIIGAGVPRIDGPDKLSGRAHYAADQQPAGLVYGYGVFSTIASGKVSQLSVARARQMPGVIEIFHHGHFPKLYRSPSSFAQGNKVEETRLPFEDERIYYAGQFVALVVADTFENARAAAREVEVSYAEDHALANLDQGVAAHGTRAGRGDHSRGDAAAAFDSAAQRIDVTYRTPVETHNPMEMHASTAWWERDHLTIFDASQGVVMARNALSKIFAIPPERVTVHAPYIGSGFGSKLWTWPHAVATAAAARELGRPVQLVVPRAQMFTTTGHRPETRQRLRLATDGNGKLVSLRHESINTTSFTDQYVETCGSVTKSLYSCPHLTVSHATTQVNRGTPTSMRAPGAAPGLFALESAVDEMAVAVGADPLAFRLDNYAERDESQDLAFSSNHIVEATQRAAERFGWDERSAEIGSMRQGREIVGYGMAACNWEALKRPCDARVSLRADGTALASCATQDIGTGTYTIVAQAVSDLTGLPLERITVELGDSSYPDGPVSGGSWATATTLPAIAKAARVALDEMKRYATGANGAFAGVASDELEVAEGGLRNTDGKQVSFADILGAARYGSADGEAHTEGADAQYSYRSFGAHFVEVRWDPGISHLRVARVVSAIDVGRVINETTARNQVEGAIVMGVGMGLFEATEYDARNGRPVNNDYAEYVVPVHADQPEVDVILLDYPDTRFNEYGARGIGEIGITGLAAAVANAVYHATGKRIRELPITLDKLMDDVPEARTA